MLLSDVDVYWFNNPLDYLTTFGPAVLVAQSDEYNLTGILISCKFFYKKEKLFLIP